MFKKGGTEIGKAMAEKSKGLFSADDWQCKRCCLLSSCQSGGDCEEWKQISQISLVNLAAKRQRIRFIVQLAAKRQSALLFS